MTSASWDLGPADVATGEEGLDLPTPVTLAYLRAILRRGRRVWISFAVAGGLLGLVAMLALPSPVSATVRLLLVHPAGVDPGLAMETDLALAGTHELASRVIDQQGLTLTPDEFLSDVSATRTTTEVLTLSVNGPDERSALSRAAALAEVFLQFRGDQVTRQASSVIAGTQDQIDELTKRIDDLTQRIAQLQGSSQPGDQASLSELVAQRAELASGVTQRNQTIQTDRLQVEGVIKASEVLDAARIDPAHAKRKAVLLVASGTVGGLALGLAWVLGGALLSNRPRRRVDIAAALEAPVILSVGRVVGTRESSRNARETVTRRLVWEIAESKGASGRWALLGVASDRETNVVAAALIEVLAPGDTTVRVVDLTDAGDLEAQIRLSVPAEAADAITFTRPGVVPTTTSAPPPLRAEPTKPEGREAKGRLGRSDATKDAGPQGRARQVTLAVGEVTPALGAEHVARWADHAVFIIAAGRASDERLRSAGQLVRGSGMDVRFAVLTGGDASDESLGLITPTTGGRDGRPAGSR